MVASSQEEVVVELEVVMARFLRLQETNNCMKGSQCTNQYVVTNNTNGGGGGGGAIFPSGNGGNGAQNGQANGGGSGGGNGGGSAKSGGGGGALGQDGQTTDNLGGSKGSAGLAIDGWSERLSGTNGDIRGAVTN